MNSPKFVQVLTAFLFITLLNIHAQGNDTLLNLMPVPAKIIKLEGKFRIDTSFTISVKGASGNRLFGAATRTLRCLSGKTGIFFTQDYIEDTGITSTTDLIINCRHVSKLNLKENEAYSLLITSKIALLSAETDLGVLHGLETFLQLLSADEKGYYIPAVKIIDKPRFPWRGLLIDVSRHFMPVDVIKRNIDAMAFVKLNVLHLHLSDDQGFRVESKIFPELVQYGSDSLYFTQSQIKDIITYAGDRGIRVIPEFDVPGHATSWLVSHPELGSVPVSKVYKSKLHANANLYKIERGWGVFNPVFNPTIPAAYKFLDKFFGEMSELFPDEYFHIGGDENNGVDWSSNKEIQKFMKAHHFKTNEELQTYFNQNILKILTKHHKKMIGWDEILQPGIPNSIVIQSWRGQASLFDAARKGYMGILSNGYYLDLCQPASYHYLNDPIPSNYTLDDAASKNILGGEAAMWSELVTPENIDSRIWPRTAAIAERLWSPDTVRNVDDMYRRLYVINRELENCGVTQLKNYDVMLRRLTGGASINALRKFVDVVEPIKGYSRTSQGVHYTSYSPYTRVADAAQPESETARYFGNLVNSYLNGDKSVEPEFVSLMDSWKENYSDIEKTIKTSPILKEIESIVLSLTRLSEAGMEAVKIIDGTAKKGDGWFYQKSEMLNEAKKTYGEVELAVIPAFEKLIMEAGGK